MCSSSPPPAPDYTAAANATAQGNLEAARAQAAANRVNQVTPYGNLTYSHTPTGTLNQPAYDSAMQKYYSDLANYNQAPAGTTGGKGGVKGVLSGLGGGTAGGSTGSRTMPVMPNQSDFMSGSQDDGWTATQTLSPQQQDILNKNQALSSGLLGTAQTGLSKVDQMLSNPAIDESKLATMPTNPGESYTDAAMRLMQPMQDRQNAALRSQMANQGITMGSEAYTNALDDQAKQFSNAQLQATMMGMDKNLTARQQGMQEQAYMNNYPLSVINALRTGNQVQGPTFVNPAQQTYAPGPDLLGAANSQYGAAVGANNAQNASNANMMSGIGSVAGIAAAMF